MLEIKNQMKAMAVITVGGGLCFGGLNIRNGNEKFYRDFVMPITHNLDPEIAHRLAVYAMKYCLIKKQSTEDPKSLVN